MCSTSTGSGWLATREIIQAAIERDARATVSLMVERPHWGIDLAVAVAAVGHFDPWKDAVRARVRELLSAGESDTLKVRIGGDPDKEWRFCEMTTKE